MQKMLRTCLFNHVDANDFYGISGNASYKPTFWNYSGDCFLGFLNLDENPNLAVFNSLMFMTHKNSCDPSHRQEQQKSPTYVIKSLTVIPGSTGPSLRSQPVNTSSLGKCWRFYDQTLAHSSPASQRMGHSWRAVKTAERQPGSLPPRGLGHADRLTETDEWEKGLLLIFAL